MLKTKNIMEDSLEELDDNNLEQTKTFKDTNIKCYKNSNPNHQSSITNSNPH